jgi:uncharacterized membrane protein
MQSLIEYLKVWQPHPFVDHFTVALILLGVVTDLVGSIFSARLWIRYMALSLMIVGAVGAAGSYVTGGWEAHRIWHSVTGPGKGVLQRHAWWGDKLPWVFGALALWRLGTQFVGFIAVTRPLYLLAAIIGGALIVYQGHLGSEMVYDYGIGTAALAPGQPTAPSPFASPSGAAPVPFASPSSPAAQTTSTPGVPAVSSSLLPSPMPSITPTPTATPSPPTPSPASANPSATSSAVPSPSPSIAGGTTINPPLAETPSPTGGGARNL